MKRKICIITTNRAEFGQLKKLIQLIKRSKKSQLQLVVTGSHLEKKYGYTIKEIENNYDNALIIYNLRNQENTQINFKNDHVLKQFECLEESKAKSHLRNVVTVAVSFQKEEFVHFATSLDQYISLQPFALETEN